MKKSIILRHYQQTTLKPNPPYNFDASLYKPSHFPSSDCHWKKGKYWITMTWKGKILGLKFENKGMSSGPKILLSIYSKEKLSDEFIKTLIPEVRYRFNMDSDISEFTQKFKKDKIIGSLIGNWGGMKPIAANSLFETLMVYFVLQNAVVRRSVQMLENLFGALGGKVNFEGKTLSYFWTAKQMDEVNEQFLRDLKVGYRAKFFKKVASQFIRGEIDEFALRKKSCQEIKEKSLEIYGIGAASVQYLLFEDFYCYDVLEVIPPWEQKILSRHLFNKELVSTKKILSFFNRYKPFRKLAFHYIWEDLFWKRQYQPIPWLEELIRL